MSDPHREPGRGPYVKDRTINNNALGWTLGALAVAAAIGLFAWGMSDRSPTTNNPPATTTGQVDPAAKTPPANPNATMPQRDPAKPQQ